jgi:Protein of unknown function (DUF3168)
MIEVAFRQLLTADTAPTTALVTDRVYFGNRPQNERRATIILTLISAIPGVTFQGRGGYVNGRIQVSCLAPTYPAAKALAEAARDVLDGFRGTQDGTVIAYIETEQLKDIPVLPLEGAGTPASYGVSVDARFMHKE